MPPRKTATKSAAPSAGRRGEGRRSKTDWLEAAAAEIAESGISAVRVDALAERLGVTKGSFYWHFKDRDALLVEVLRSWRLELTSNIARAVAEKTKDPAARLRLLLKLSTANEPSRVPGGRFEQAIREWAHSSPIAQQALREVDNERLSILTPMYQDLGKSKKEAAAYAFLFYSYVIGSNTIDSDLGLRAARAVHELCANILVDP